MVCEETISDSIVSTYSWDRTPNRPIRHAPLKLGTKINTHEKCETKLDTHAGLEVQINTHDEFENQLTPINTSTQFTIKLRFQNNTYDESWTQMLNRSRYQLKLLVSWKPKTTRVSKSNPFEHIFRVGNLYLDALRVGFKLDIYVAVIIQINMHDELGNQLSIHRQTNSNPKLDPKTNARILEGFGRTETSHSYWR